MDEPKLRKPHALAIALALVGVLVAANLVNAPAAADNVAANRMSAAGSALEVMSAPLVDGASSVEHTLLTGRVKLASPYDLVLRVTAECALWTDVTTVGDDDSEAVAAVTLWVEIDGEPVPVADESEDVGEVVFCNRAYRRVTTNFGENQTIETYLASRSANAFNWFALNPGGGGAVHEIAVKARLDVQVTGAGNAQAAVGKRTLVVEPVRLADSVTA